MKQKWKSRMNTVIDTVLIYTEDIDDRSDHELAIETEFQLEENHVLIRCHNRTMELKIDVDQLHRISTALVTARNAAKALYDKDALG